MHGCYYFIPTYGRTKKNMPKADYNPPMALHAYHLPN